MKDKIILLNPPVKIKYIRDFYCSFSSKANYYWPPQDLIALSGVLRDRYDIEIIDAVGCGFSDEVCRDKIGNGDAGTVIFATGASTLEEDMRFIEKVKRYRDIRAIASSSIFRYAGQETMEKYPFLEALLTDFTDRSIAGCLAMDDANCDSMIRRKLGGVYRAPIRKEGDFSIGLSLQGAFINRGCRIPMFGNYPFATIISSIGCNFGCRFCAAGTVKFRKRVLSEVIDEIRHTIDIGVKRVFFSDPVFTADKKRVLEFCGAIRENKMKIGWVCNAHPSTILDAGLLGQMKDAGCNSLMLGVESSSDEILKMYNKATSVAQIKQAFKLCMAAGIKTLAYFILGLPGEDALSLERTIRFARDIACDYASFSYATADIGTDLRRESLGMGWIASPGIASVIDSSRATNIAAGHISGEGLNKLMRNAYRRFYMRPGYIARRALEARSIADISFLLEGGGLLLKKNAW